MSNRDEVKYLVEALNLNKKVHYDDFFVFRFEDCKDISPEIDNPRYKQYFDISISKHDKGVLMVGSESYTNLDNTISFIPPGQLFSYHIPDGESQTEGICIMFKSSFFQGNNDIYNIISRFPFFNIRTIPLYKLDKQQQDRLYNLFEEIHTEYDKNDYASKEIIYSYLLIILNMINRIIFKDLEPVEFTRHTRVAVQFENIVMRNVLRSNNISDYSRHMNISEVYLRECVRKTTGKSPKQIINNHRILNAKALLHQSSMTVSEISFKLGFDEPTNFIKFFKRYTSITPKQFRDSAK